MYPVKKTLIVSLILSSGLLSACATQTAQMPVSNSSPTTATTTITQDAFPAPKYIPYESEILTQVATPKRVLFFYANWCPTCKPVDAELSTKTAEIPNDVTVIRVNYNDTDTDEEEKNLARKYGVTYQHTFVQIDQDGNEVRKWNGGGLEDLIEKAQ